MRLTSLETAIVSLPLETPVRTTIHNIVTVDCILVTLDTDEKLSGVGLLWCFGIDRARVLDGMVKDLFAKVRGRDAWERQDILRDLLADASFLGSTGAALFGISAIDQALWDIAGKARALPLYRLLGAAPKSFDVYAGGLWLSSTVDELVAEAHGYVAKGFKGIKMRVGAPRWQDDIARVEAVRAAIGPNVALMADSTQGWDVGQAVAIARELERFHLTWIEEPVAYQHPAGLAAVASRIDTPVAAGESVYGLYGFRDLIASQAVDIAMPDIQRVGGITTWLKVATLAEAVGMRVAPHVFTEICIHLLCAIPNGIWPEFSDWWDPLFVDPLRVIDGAVTPPSAPGLGLTFNWDRIERHRVK